MPQLRRAFAAAPAAPRSVLLLLLAAGSSWAQTPPDAGRILRDLQQSPVPAPVTPAPAPAQQPGRASAAADQQTVLVRSVRIDGNQEIPTGELRPLVDGLVGKPQSLADLDAAARSITQHYRSRGFAVARAYLPTQDVTAGNVVFAVLEGRISGRRLTNRSLVSDQRVDGYLAQLDAGRTVRSDAVDRGLLLLQDTPGVGGSRATLQPGASVGTTELLVEVDPARRLAGSATVDNHGSRSTGDYRLSAQAQVASPLGTGDQVSIGALTTGPGLNFARLAYQLPVGADGLSVGAAYFATRYRLGREFAALQAQGEARSASVYAAYPFVRSVATNLSGTLSYERKQLQDRVVATGTSTDKAVRVAGAGLSGSRQDRWLGGGVSSADLNIAVGELDIQSPAARAIDAASARTQGRYVRVSYGLSRQQALTPLTHVLVAFSGQRASRNLDSSEKFVLGGVNGVRAYPQGEAVGDEGERWTIELRRSLSAQLQGLAFYDHGAVRINKDAFSVGADNRRHLSGAGFGVLANVAPSFQLRASLAWRVHGGAPTSIPASAARQPTLWLQGSASF